MKKKLIIILNLINLFWIQFLKNLDENYEKGFWKGFNGFLKDLEFQFCVSFEWVLRDFVNILFL